MVDANQRVLAFESGAYGWQHDATVFGESALGQWIAKKKFPKPEELPGTDVKCPFVILTDKAYTLHNNMIKPYLETENKTTKEQKVYKRKVSGTRRNVEQFFGQLTQQFHIFQRPLEMSKELNNLTILGGGLLHNIIFDCETERSLTMLEYQIEARPRRQFVSNKCHTTRDLFVEYFSAIDLSKRYHF